MIRAWVSKALAAFDKCYFRVGRRGGGRGAARTVGMLASSAPSEPTGAAATAASRRAVSAAVHVPVGTVRVSTYRANRGRARVGGVVTVAAGVADE